MWLFFVSLTQDKFDIVQFIPTQIKFLATPLSDSGAKLRSLIVHTHTFSLSPSIFILL